MSAIPFMRATTRRGLALLVLASVLPGCAAAGLTLFGVGAGVSAGTATDYTLNGIAYRTFAADPASVHRATLAALKRMGMTVKTDDSTADGRALAALAGERNVEIELQTLTTRTTRMRVTVKDGVFFRDRSTAGEIIAQTEHALDRAAAVSRKS